MAWQVQEAKQRFSELLRLAAADDQIITRQGVEVAAVVDIDEYRRLRQAAQTSTRKYIGLFPPLADQEYADVLDTIIAQRPLATASARVTPDFGG